MTTIERLRNEIRILRESLDYINICKCDIADIGPSLSASHGINNMIYYRITQLEQLGVQTDNPHENQHDDHTQTDLSTRLLPLPFRQD